MSLDRTPKKESVQRGKLKQAIHSLRVGSTMVGPSIACNPVGPSIYFDFVSTLLSVVVYLKVATPHGGS